MGVVLGRAPQQLPGVQLVQLPLDPDRIGPHVLRLQANQLTPPHPIKASTFTNDTDVSSTLATFADTDVPTQHRYTFDNLGRQTVDALWSAGAQVMQTTTAYDGDRTTITPPTGGTATRTISNAQGKTIELDQYLGGTPTGTLQATGPGHITLIPADQSHWHRTRAVPSQCR